MENFTEYQRQVHLESIWDLERIQLWKRSLLSWFLPLVVRRLKSRFFRHGKAVYIVFLITSGSYECYGGLPQLELSARIHAVLTSRRKSSWQKKHVLDFAQLLSSWDLGMVSSWRCCKNVRTEGFAVGLYLRLTFWLFRRLQRSECGA